MKKLLVLLLVLFISKNIRAQYLAEDTYMDTIITDESQIEMNPAYVSAIDLTGSIQVMNIIIGFPDRTHTWPILINWSANHPNLGTFRDGTLLKDYITTHWGSISVEEWYEQAFEDYLEINSGGRYTGDAIFPQPGNGNTYLTDSTLLSWINKNGDANCVCYNFWDEMANQVAK